MVFSRKAIFRFLIITAGTLGVLHLVIVHLMLWSSSPYLIKLQRLFHLNFEIGFGSFFSGLILLLAAFVLWQVAGKATADKGRWQLLSIIFLFLSLDETLAFHEELVHPFRLIFGELPFLYHAWVIAALPVLVFIGFIFLPFLFRLPAGIRNRFIIAGAMYVGGAVGLETLSGLYAFNQGVDGDYQLDLLIFAEEMLEMFGVILFIDAVIRFAIMHHLPLTTEISEQTT